ncbi:MAG: flavin reductase family protein [Thermoanaerobaculaceae bacterium]
MTPETFRAALAHFASGVTVVTAKWEEDFRGMTATAFTSGPLDPPLVLVAVANSAKLLPLLFQAKGFGVNILAWQHRGLLGGGP